MPITQEKTNLTPKTLSLLAVAASAVAAVTSLVSLPVLAERFGLTWGGKFYLLTPLPYIVLAILAIIFRSTVAGAAISLIGALVLGALGVYGMYATTDAMGIGILPFALLIGCGVILLAQLVRGAIMLGKQRRA